MKKIEIYFYDLRDEAQKRLLEFYGVDDPSELNVDIFPICSLEKDDDET